MMHVRVVFFLWDYRNYLLPRNNLCCFLHNLCCIFLLFVFKRIQYISKENEAHFLIVFQSIIFNVSKKGTVMANFNMLDDFRFIFPKKIDVYKNVEAKSVDFGSLERDYCICLYQEADGYRPEKVVNLITELRHEYTGCRDGKVEFESDPEMENINQLILESVKKDIHKKIKIFNRVRQCHNDMVRRYKNLGNLCFSLFASGLPGEPIPEHAKTLKRLSTHFFNNIRSLTTFKHHVLGYFWVVLKNSSDNRPYLHVNFYLDTKHFNHVIGEEINQCWFNALGAMQNRQGGVMHLTISPDYINGKMSTTTENYMNQNSVNQFAVMMHEVDGFIMLNDLNNKESGVFKTFTNNNNKKFFTTYLYALAKESYFISKDSRSFGVSFPNKKN